MLREKMREETVGTLKELGVTSIMVTHDPEEALTEADRIVLMNEGEVVQIGTPEELFRSPSTVFCARFFGRISQVEGVVEGETVKTDLGSFPNPKLSNGSEVQVLFRPEALRVLPSQKASISASELLVCGIQYTGNSSLIRLGIGKGPNPHTHIELRDHEVAPYVLGEKIWVEIDPDQAFVFQK
jgi:iron(III) transport system ATP-binding protein